MREIEFRGQSLEDGSWVYGDFKLSWGEAFISWDFNLDGYHNRSTEQVDPETVGLYTGFKDKDGKRIFEGDILEDISGYPYKCLWEETSSAFLFQIMDFARDFYEPHDFFIKNGNYGRVIGNIYDNGVLIKKETK